MCDLASIDRDGEETPHTSGTCCPHGRYSFLVLQIIILCQFMFLIVVVGVLCHSTSDGFADLYKFYAKHIGCIPLHLLSITPEPRCVHREPIRPLCF